MFQFTTGNIVDSTPRLSVPMATWIFVQGHKGATPKWQAFYAKEETRHNSTLLGVRYQGEVRVGVDYTEAEAYFAAERGEDDPVAYFFFVGEAAVAEILEKVSVGADIFFMSNGTDRFGGYSQYE